MSMNKTKLVTNAFFVLGIIILGFMINKIGIDVIWENIKLTKWWFFAIVGIWGVVYLINTVSLQLIIRDGSEESKSVSFVQTFRLIISGYAINQITPAGLLGGEPYRIMKLKPKIGIQKATSSVLLYMMMHVVSHFIFWMTSIPLLLFLVPGVSQTIKLILFAVAVGSLFLLYWSFTFYSKGFIVKALTIASKIPFLGKKVRVFYRKHQEKIIQMDYLIADLYKNRKKDFIYSLTIEILSRYVQCIEIVLMMYAIGYPITFAASVLIEAVQSLVGNIFFFMPMQLGAREGGFLIVFGLLGFAATHGVYVSLCMRIRDLVWSVIGMGIIRYDSRKRSEEAIPQENSSNY